MKGETVYVELRSNILDRWYHSGNSRIIRNRRRGDADWLDSVRNRHHPSARASAQRPPCASGYLSMADETSWGRRMTLKCWKDRLFCMPVAVILLILPFAAILMLWYLGWFGSAP